MGPPSRNAASRRSPLRESMSIGRIRFGVARARAQEKGTVTTSDRSRHPAWCPCSPSGLIRLNQLVHTDGRSNQARRCVAWFVTLRAWIGIPALRRDPRTDLCSRTETQSHARTGQEPARNPQGAQTAIVRAEKEKRVSNRLLDPLADCRVATGLLTPSPAEKR